MNLLRNIFTLYFETPGAAGGGAGTVDPVQPAQGQGEGQPQNGDAGFWQYFPNVPQEHRALLQPHIGEMERYVTQLQQQLSPLKPVLDSGYDARALQGLIGFEQRFQQEPLQLWLDMAQQLQTPGPNGEPPVIDPSVDLEHLALISRGEDPDEGLPVGGTQSVAGSEGQGLPPEVQQYMAQQQQRIEQLEQRLQQGETERTTQIQDQVLERRMAQTREALINSGYPKELVESPEFEKELVARVIAYNGDFPAVAKSLIDQRAALLKGFTENRPTPPPTELPNGVPGSPDRGVSSRNAGDPFKVATKNAEARLRRANQPG